MTMREKSLYAELLEHCLDAAFLTIPDGRILYANPAASEIFGYTLDEFQKLGRNTIVDPSDPRLVVALAQRRETGRFRGVLRVRRKDGSRFSAVLSSAVYALGSGEQRTSMFVRDLTEQEHREEALRVANEELKRAMEEIKTLRGIIPICASCKKIRDDNGYWHQVEAYVSQRTHALFSHGLCSDCLRKLYSEGGEEDH